MTNVKLTKKNVNYKVHNYNNTKYIYIINQAGFGNKIYDLIFAIYLYNLYNTKNNVNYENIYKTPIKCIINYVLIKSNHQKNNDPTINNIFPNSKYKINYISDVTYKLLTNNQNIKFSHIENTEKYQSTNDTNDTNTKKILESLDTFPKYEELSQHTIMTNNFKLVYEMYKTFSQKDKDIFLNINKNILTDKTTLNNITSQSYSLVHIRYGDKLYYLSQYINKPDIDISKLLDVKKDKSTSIDQFLLYTPEYYINKINELLETTNENMKIYIITDSANIVRQFIMNNPSIKDNNKTNNRIVFLDKLTWWDSFYLFYYASNIILSNSTFCFAGAYFNKKNAKCEMVIYHHNQNSFNIADEEYAISPEWKITNERKYVLNYTPKIAYMIIKYKYFWSD